MRRQMEVFLLDLALIKKLGLLSSVAVAPSREGAKRVGGASGDGGTIDIVRYISLIVRVSALDNGPSSILYRFFDG